MAGNFGHEAASGPGDRAPLKQFVAPARSTLTAGPVPAEQPTRELEGAAPPAPIHPLRRAVESVIAKVEVKGAATVIRAADKGKE